MKEFAIPVLVFAVNVALAVVTGLWIYALAAVVIGALVILKLKNVLRERNRER